MQNDFYSAQKHWTNLPDLGTSPALSLRAIFFIVLEANVVQPLINFILNILKTTPMFRIRRYRFNLFCRRWHGNDQNRPKNKIDCLLSPCDATRITDMAQKMDSSTHPNE